MLKQKFKTNPTQLSQLSGVAIPTRQATKDGHGSSLCRLARRACTATPLRGLADYKARLKLPPLATPLLLPVPEFVDQVFVKTSPKRSFRFND